MALSVNYPFDTQSNYTKTSKLEFSGGKCQGAIQSNPAQEFEQDFSNDTGFTYDSAKAEFSGGQVQQKDQRPANSIVGVTYTGSLNANWGADGFASLTAILNGTPVLSGGKVSCVGSNGVAYQDALIGNVAGGFVIKFKYTPNYTSGPASNVNLVALTDPAGGATDRVVIFNSPSGNNLRITAPGLSASSFGVWNPTAGQEYTFEVICISNQVSLYVDNVQIGTAKTITTPRTTTGTRLTVGAHPTQYNVADGSFNDVILYSTASQTPTYTVPEAQYLTSIVDLPQFAYTGVGAVQVFTNFVPTESNAPRWVLNGLYWDGAAWSASSDSWATASPVADVVTNIAALPASDTLDVSIVFNDGATQMSVSNLVVEYTGQIYPAEADNQKVYSNSSIRTDTLKSYLQTVSTNIKVHFKYNSQAYYWNGAAWVTSDGTYSQSNTAAELTTIVLNAFPSAPQDLTPVWVFGGDGSTQEYIEDCTIGYDFYGPSPTQTIATIWDYHHDLNGTPKANVLISANLLDTAEMPSQGSTLGVLKQEVYTDSNGYWEIKVAYDATDQQPAYIRFLINGVESKKVMLYQATMKFSEMADLGV